MQLKSISLRKDGHYVATLDGGHGNDVSLVAASLGELHTMIHECITEVEGLHQADEVLDDFLENIIQDGFGLRILVRPLQSSRLSLERLHQSTDMRFDHNLVQRQGLDFIWNHAHWRQMLTLHVRPHLVVIHREISEQIVQMLLAKDDELRQAFKF